VELVLSELLGNHTARNTCLKKTPLVRIPETKINSAVFSRPFLQKKCEKDHRITLVRLYWLGKMSFLFLFCFVLVFAMEVSLEK